MTQSAYMYYDEGKKYLRINPDSENPYDESISGFTYVMHMTHGYGIWRHTDGREYIDHSGLKQYHKVQSMLMDNNVTH